MAQTSHGFMLRPLSVGDIFDQGFQIFRRWWKPLLTASALVYVPYGLLTTVAMFFFARMMQALESSAGEPAIVMGAVSFFSALLLGGLYVLIVYPIALGLVCWITSQAFLGEPISLVSAWQRVRRRLGVLIGSTLIQWLAILVVVGLVMTPVVVVVATAPSGASSSDASPLAAVLTFLFCFPLAIGCLLFLSIALCCMPCVATLEDHGVVTTIVRSYRLVKGLFWKTAGLFFLSILLVMVVSMVFQMPLMVWAFVRSVQDGLAGAAEPTIVTDPIFNALNALSSTFGSLLTEPLRGAFFVLLYYDLRIRQEAFDLELLAHSLGYHRRPVGNLCSQCDHLNLPDTQFCMQCGTALDLSDTEASPGASPLPRQCPRCQTPLRADDHFCRRCGTRYPSDHETQGSDSKTPALTIGEEAPTDLGS